MYLLLSGEGKSDMGVCYPAQKQCEGEQFEAGAMAVIVDQLMQIYQGYEFSYLDNACMGFVSENCIADHKLKPIKKLKSLKIRGKKRPAETRYYFENARRLADLAKIKAEELNDVVIAVLFRDADGTASAGRGNWNDKHASMLRGFKEEVFEYGVAMLPNPKSEAWLICAVKDKPYQSCYQLEESSGNNKGQVPLKEQLSKILEGQSSVSKINQMLKDKQIDIERVDMPSFNKFKESLDTVFKVALSQK